MGTARFAGGGLYTATRHGCAFGVSPSCWFGALEVLLLAADVPRAAGKLSLDEVTQRIQQAERSFNAVLEEEDASYVVFLQTRLHGEGRDKLRPLGVTARQKEDT
eukprot:Skav208430  [mRNA]  locus=scaffold2953:566439:572488:- [translate_table: standard]